MHQPIIALREKDFRPLIDTAYYSGNNFHFDLTRAEALRLLEMFTHRQVSFPLDHGHTFCLRSFTAPQPMTSTMLRHLHQAARAQIYCWKLS